MRPLAILSVLFALAAPSLADDSKRIAPPLRTLLRRGARLPTADGTMSVSVRVDGDEDLASKGFDIRPGAGAIVYARVTVEELARLTSLPSVRAVEPLGRLKPSLDKSVPLTGAPVARAELGLDGTGVVVGIVDTGCDFRHLDLRAVDGTTRVAALLDMSHARGTLHPELGSYNGAALWLAADIDTELTDDAAGITPTTPVLERDVDGHGTHVTGIAAGSGRATGNGLPAGRYVGMAPGATIIAVDATRDGHSFGEDDVVAGVRFVFDQATALARPAVVNLSLSGEGGPHDGTANFEQALEALLPAGVKGRAMVVAAGNGGTQDGHASGTLAGSVEVTMPFPMGASESEAIDIDLWFSGPPPSVTLVAPDGTSFGPVAAKATLDGGATPTEGAISIDNASMGADPMNGRYESYLELRGNHGTGPQGGDWKLVLAGTVARWDAWMIGAPTSGDPRFADHLDEDDRAATPAFTPSVITVGSFVTKNAWTTEAGTAVTRSTVLGDTSSFTATGPTSDGRFLPDLAAPGDFITSTLSQDALPELCSPGCVPNSGSSFFVAGAPDYLWADDGVHGTLRGTSQATPHVTGAAALLFQQDPSLTGAELREALRAAAHVETGAPGFSTREGFGRLDVAAAARLVSHHAVGAVDALASTVGTSTDWAFPGQATPILVSVVPRDATGAPLGPLGPGHTVTIAGGDARSQVLAKFLGPATDAGEGRYESAMTAAGPNGAALTITATVDGVTLAAQPIVWLVTDRDDIGRPAASGGCGVGGSNRTLWPLGSLLALALLTLSRRRRGATKNTSSTP